MKIFRSKALFILLLMCTELIATDYDPHHHRHESRQMAKNIKLMKTEYKFEMDLLRADIYKFKQDVTRKCNHEFQPDTTEEKDRDSMWANKAVRDLRSEMKKVSEQINDSALLHELQQLRKHVKHIMAETAEFKVLTFTLETRMDKMDKVVETLNYEKKNLELMIAEYREEVEVFVEEMKHWMVSPDNAINDFAEMNVIRTVTGPLLPEKNHKIRHSKMIVSQISRLAKAQGEMNEIQKAVKAQMLDYQRRLDRLEKPNWNTLKTKIDILHHQAKGFSDRLNNNTQVVKDFQKMHASLLELREEVESLENKIDKTVPDFRREISQLDVNLAQSIAHFKYMKEDQENLRQSVKAIAVSVSNTQDHVEEDRHELKKISVAVDGLSSQTKTHFYRLNDHILKSETNKNIKNVPGNDLTETISLPELMTEVKQLQPVEKEYEDLVAQLPKDCSGISGPAGSYIIRPGFTTVDAWCKNGTTLIQRRCNGSVEFNRKFTDYVHGFGNPKSEFWLGLETMHLLTSDNCSSMRIDMTDIYGAAWYAEYETFNVGSGDNGYVLSVSGFKGNASDAFEYQNHMEFSTIDRDRDISNTHCAGNYEGGWWFSHCQHVNINGKYTLGLTWFNSNKNEWIAVVTTEMKIYRRPGCF